MSCVDDDSENSTGTKIELDPNADTCVLGDHCLVVHDHNRSVNVFEYNPKVGSKHTCIVDASVVYTEPSDRSSC